jgi:tetratricopeptide (TPR) repeat protein
MSALEWSLIRGAAVPQDLDGRLRELAEALVNADFKAILLSEEAKSVLSNSASDQPEIRLIIAIALLHSFVQANWTGPDLEFNPDDVVSTPDAIPQLTLNGEPAYHLITHPSLLLAAVRLLDSIQLPTLPWWRLRFHLVHISILDEPVDLSPESHQALESIPLPDDADLSAAFQLERGLLQHALGQDKAANKHFLAASKDSGLEFELTGAMGIKTKFQQEAHSQLVLLAESRSRTDDEEYPTTAPTLPSTLALNDETLLEETKWTKSDPSSSSKLAHLDPATQPPLHPLDQSLLLSLCLSQHNQEPEFGLMASQMMPFVTRVLTHPRNWSIHTVALLLRSRLESTRSRTVERSTLQLAALIEQMPTSDSTPKERLRWFHQIPLPSKWEMERELAKRYLSLGVVRSALDIFTRLEMWEDAVSCLQRLEKEDEAGRIVRDLLEGRKIESDLVTTMARTDISDSRRSNLTTGRQAKLWCLLGDLALSGNDPAAAKTVAMEHYTKAWEVSNKTSSRAMRSLGSLHFSAREYPEAVECLRHSVAINPLYGRAWFTLGVCLVRMEKWVEARDAFRRQVGVDEDDGEGWNNLAAVYLRLDESEGSKGVSFENKILAWRALRQGLRHARNNWRMWTNYMIVSIDVGELAEAARALTRVVEERAAIDGQAALDIDVLDKIVDGVMLDDYSLLKQGTVVPKTSNEGFGLLPIVERLFEVTILPRISDSSRVWTSHARLLRWKEDWNGAMDDYLKAYRCGIASDLGVETDLAKFKQAVVEVQELVDLMQAVGPRGDGAGAGGKKSDWRFTARGLVRTFIGRTKQS